MVDNPVQKESPGKERAFDVDDGHPRNVEHEEVVEAPVELAGSRRCLHPSL